MQDKLVTGTPGTRKAMNLAQPAPDLVTQTHPSPTGALGQRCWLSFVEQGYIAGFLVGPRCENKMAVPKERRKTHCFPVLLLHICQDGAYFLVGEDRPTKMHLKSHTT